MLRPQPHLKAKLSVTMWQTSVGKTYGLWKCVDSVSGEAVTSAKTETVS